jgi:hypothetical protein
MTAPLRELPAGLGEPLHLQEPWIWSWLLWALVLLVLDLWWWRRIVGDLRRLSRPVRRPRPPRTAPAKTDGSDELQRLHRTHAEAETYRQGCHALSQLVRRELDAAQGRPALWTRFTARELEDRQAATAEHPAQLRFLRMLERHQFRRRGPTESDWNRMCHLAREVLGLGDVSDEGEPR